MATHLLDTNILSDLVRHPSGNVARRLSERGEQSVCTSIIAACELRFGAAKKNSEVLTGRVGQLLDRLTVLPLGPGVDHRYAEVRVHLEAAGTPIGPNDLLLAAHALEEGVVVVTDNVREFTRVPGLTVENWLEPSPR